VYIVSAVLSSAFFLVSAIIGVRWSTPAQHGITIEAPARESDIVACLETSQQARLRFEVRVCRRRSGWLDYCEESRSELHTAQFDEVLESYRVVSDRFGDDREPTAVGVPSRTEAVRLARTLQNIPLSFLVRDEPDILNNPNAYLQVRTVFICRGGSSRPIAHLSRVLTLGIVNNVEDRSEWEDFTLTSHTGITPR
jgi:hypothetical protein